jgi:hypothetical protein
MGAFKRRDAAEAQMQQQAASYSRALACGLLAAGHQPSLWLLPHPASFAALFRRGTAEEQMRLQVEAYSKSIACALIDAGHCLRRGSFCTALLEKGPPSVRCRRTRRCGSRWCPTSSPWSASSSPPATAPRVARPVPCRRGHYRR